MRAYLIGCHLPVGHKCQFDVDNIICELATVEKACRTRIIVGQDVREQEASDLVRLVCAVSKGLKRSDKAGLKMRPVLRRVYRVEQVFSISVVENGVDRWSSHAIIACEISSIAVR